MAAELEEVVVNADALHVQHFAPDPDDLFFECGARTHVAGTRGVEIRRRQRLPVGLAVGEPRHGLELDEMLRHHVFGQPRAQMRAQLARRRHRPGRDDIRDETRIAGCVLARDDDGLRNMRMRSEVGFDFSELDAIAADLHLEIEAPLVFEQAVVAPPATVARAIKPLRRAAAERICDEALGSQLRAVEIAERDTGSADVDLAGDAGRAKLAMLVEHAHDRVVDRPSDTDPVLRDVSTFQSVEYTVVSVGP